MDEIKIIRALPDPVTEAVYEDDKQDRAKASQAAQLIGGSFVWGDTVEGEGFWTDVTERLRQIAENGRLK
jgi:hypothetical protein